MNRFERRVTLRVLAIHVGVILFLGLQSLLHGCFRPKPKPDNIEMFVEFGEAPPTPMIEEVQEMPEPEPPREAPAPEPEPDPVVPDPVKVPDPVRKTVEPPPKKKVDPPKPKSDWKPVDPKDIDPNKSRRIDPTPAQPKINVKGAFDDIVREPVAQTGNPDETAAYIARIGNYFDRYWKQPPAASTALSTVVRVYFTKSGAITQRRKITGSGDAEFDQSAMNAVNSVSTVPKPPAGFPYEYVEVEFRIKN